MGHIIINISAACIYLRVVVVMVVIIICVNNIIDYDYF